MKRVTVRDLIGVVAVGLCMVLPARTWAGGAYIYETGNPTDIGLGSAGLAARAQDPGTVFTNPAGMTRFRQSELLLTGYALYLHAPFDPDSNTTASGSDGSTSELFPGGSAAYVHPLSPKMALGISVQNYFGLSLDWSDDWVGRYEGVSTTLIAPQVQPSVAYKVNDWLSVGAGAALTLGYLSDKTRVNTLDPARDDGKLRYSDTDFAVQGNFGLMIEPSNRTRIGLRYLTETDLDFKDRINASGIGPGLGSGGLIDLVTPANGLDLGMKMPQSVMLGAYHELNDQWAILGSVGWDDWSEFSRVRVRVVDTAIDTTVDAGFRDVWHFGAAAQYRHSPQWLLSAGFSYDTSMATDATRPLILPLGSMYRYGAGFTYQKGKDLTLGAAMEFLYEGNLPITETGGDLSGKVSGKYENVSLTFLTVYANWKFD